LEKLTHDTRIQHDRQILAQSCHSFQKKKQKGKICPNLAKKRKYGGSGKLAGKLN